MDRNHFQNFTILRHNFMAMKVIIWASSWVLERQRLQAGQYMAPIHVYMDDHPDLNHPIH